MKCIACGSALPLPSWPAWKIRTFADAYGVSPATGWLTVPHNIPGSGERTADDLDRAARSISRHFLTDTVFIIGSQSILVDRPDAPVIMRTSGEIDAYPGNIREWEAHNPDLLASEEINVLFGIGSRFHMEFGFYIDGVDDNTAKLPPDWRERAVEKSVPDGGKLIRVIAPCLEDLIVSKLRRLSLKNEDFVRACHHTQRLDVELIKARLAETGPDPDITARACQFLDTL
jgi:hypothetical protein